MKKLHLPSRMLSLLLAFALLLSFATPIRAADDSTGVRFQQVDNSMVSGSLLCEAEEEPTVPKYSDTDLVRVSIFLNKKSTLEAGYSTAGIAQNTAAMSYRNSVETAQKALTASIERTLGEKLDVRWNLTLAANAISANVEYGQIAKIEQIPGVQKVVLETRYEPQEAATGADAGAEHDGRHRHDRHQRSLAIRLYGRRQQNCHSIPVWISSINPWILRRSTTRWRKTPGKPVCHTRTMQPA